MAAQRIQSFASTAGTLFYPVVTESHLVIDFLSDARDWARIRRTCRFVAFHRVDNVRLLSEFGSGGVSHAALYGFGQLCWISELHNLATESVGELPNRLQPHHKIATALAGFSSRFCTETVTELSVSIAVGLEEAKAAQGMDRVENFSLRLSCCLA